MIIVCGSIVCDLRGIVTLLVDQITLFVLLCFRAKVTRSLKSVFIKPFDLEYDLC